MGNRGKSLMNVQRPSTFLIAIGTGWSVPGASSMCGKTGSPRPRLQFLRLASSRHSGNSPIQPTHRTTGHRTARSPRQTGLLANGGLNRFKGRPLPPSHGVAALAPLHHHLPDQCAPGVRRPPNYHASWPKNSPRRGRRGGLGSPDARLVGVREAQD